MKDPKERTKMFECISQSKEFAAEYNRKREALLKAQEDTQFHFNKKKSATAERKQMFRDKVEVTTRVSVNKHISKCWLPCWTGSDIKDTTTVLIDREIPFNCSELSGSF